MPKEPICKREHSLFKPEINRPELVPRQRPLGRQHRKRFRQAHRRLLVGRIGYNSHESCFGQRARSPTQVRSVAKPAFYLFMCAMVLVRQGDQHVHIDQIRGLPLLGLKRPDMLSSDLFLTTRQIKHRQPVHILDPWFSAVSRSQSTPTRPCPGSCFGPLRIARRFPPLHHREKV